ncbi:DEKNAAC103980 [Brettanomyces naardenensis]|uniref:Threonylcarbamoyl-AMP synthase n=1 Tax=Brettanomyces naardenensis TaxID=13370 RepID=A0A448YPX4_BRENA|nr:DEKNAAC103980 [Brettanomyces naardenensis]
MSLHTKVIKVDKNSIHFSPEGRLTITDKVTENALKEATEIIKTPGGVVAFPTETVYGLGGSSLCTESVKAIYAAKHRPADNPLISHIASIDQLQRRLLLPGQEIPEVYKPLIDKFWPGPLTIILPIPDKSKSPISTAVTANGDTFTVRMPVHPIARALISMCDLPIAAPSANASTRPSPTRASHVYHDLKGRIPLILDGGSCDVGLESTVIDGTVDPPMLLRPGGVSVEQIRAAGGPFWKKIVIARRLSTGKNEPVKTPGMKYRHYSPTAEVVLFIGCGDGVSSVRKYVKDKGLEGKKIALLRSKEFAEAKEMGIEIERDLGRDGLEIQRNVFSELREVDEMGVDYIFVEGVGEDHEGLAIMNRLNKAASVVVREQAS